MHQNLNKASRREGRSVWSHHFEYDWILCSLPLSGENRVTSAAIRSNDSQDRASLVVTRSEGLSQLRCATRPWDERLEFDNTLWCLGQMHPSNTYNMGILRNFTEHVDSPHTDKEKAFTLHQAKTPPQNYMEACGYENIEDVLFRIWSFGRPRRRLGRGVFLSLFQFDSKLFIPSSFLSLYQ